MNNKKIWLKVITVCIFVGVCCISFVLLSYLLRPVTTSRRNICGFYAEDKNSLDAVFVGGSVCYTSWEPLSAWNQYGFTSYNFAIDALQPQVIKYALEEVKKTQSPKLFVIDLRPFQYGNLIGKQEKERNMDRVAAFRNFSDNIKYSGNRIRAIEDGAPKQEDKWTYQFDIAKYHSGISAFVSLENWQYILNEKRLYTKGFCGYEDSGEVSVLDVRGITDELALEEEVDVIFIELLEYCRQNDFEVLFLVYGYGSSEEDQKKYNYMERRIEEYGFDFLNMNEHLYDLQMDFSKDFHDVDHVTLLGADKYTDFLAEYLSEEYDLPDRRAEEAYEQWNEDYRIWNAEMEMIRENLKK